MNSDQDFPSRPSPQVTKKGSQPSKLVDLGAASTYAASQKTTQPSQPQPNTSNQGELFDVFGDFSTAPTSTGASVQSQNNPGVSLMDENFANFESAFDGSTVPQQPRVNQQIPQQPMINQPFPQQPMVNQQISQQPMVHQQIPQQPMANQQIPQQPMANQQIPQQPMVNQQIPQQPMANQQIPQQHMVQQQQDGESHFFTLSLSI